MTGSELRELRESFGWSAMVMARIVGVGQSTLYRWERQGANAFSVEPGSERLLTAAASIPADARRGVGAAARRGLHLRGELYALYVVLKACYEANPVPG